MRRIDPSWLAGSAKAVWRLTKDTIVGPAGITDEVGHQRVGDRPAEPALQGSVGGGGIGGGLVEECGVALSGASGRELPPLAHAVGSGDEGALGVGVEIDTGEPGRIDGGKRGIRGRGDSEILGMRLQ
jgi:hypothetical protein